VSSFLTTQHHMNGHFVP